MEPRGKLPHVEMPVTWLRNAYEPALRLFAILVDPSGRKSIN